MRGHRQSRLFPPASALCASRRGAGFTLMETLMVLALGGLLLLAAASFLFGVMTLRKEIEEVPQLGQHADGVGRLMETLFSGAEPHASSDGSTGALPVSWRDLPDAFFGSERALYLRVRPGVPLFVGEQGAVGSTVDCYLQLEREGGLVLFWQSERMRRDDADNWERTVLSPLITAVDLLYYDAERERWETREGLEPLSGDSQVLPQAMVINFADPASGREAKVEVLLPAVSLQLSGL